MVRGISEDSKALQGTALGGLNLTTSPLAMSLSDSPVLVNGDVDDSGNVTKRLGTRLIGNVAADVQDVYPVVTNLGKSLFFTFSGDLSYVFYISDDTMNLVALFLQMFIEPRVGNFDYTVLPGQYTRLVACCEDLPPIVYTIYELRIRADSDTTTVTSTGVIPQFQTPSIVLVNGVITPVTHSYNAGTDTLTLTGTFQEGDVIDSLRIEWAWGAEAELWYGDNFHRSVYRPNSTPSDRLVPIPETIYADLEQDTEEYGILVYQSTAYDNLYIETNQPQHAFEYGFSNGKVYEYDPDDTLPKSPFFVSFGTESGFLSYTFSDTDIVDSTFYIPNHGYKDFDVVTFSDSSIDGVLNDTPYYVGVIDTNHFRLYSDPALTTLVVVTPGTPVTFTDLDINWEANRIVGIAPGFPVGSVNRVRFPSPPPGLTSIDEYWVHVTDVDRVEVYLDEQITRKADLIPPRCVYYSGANVDAANDTITITGHGFFEGQRVIVSGGVLQEPPMSYFTELTVGVLDANLIRLRDAGNIDLIVTAPGLYDSVCESGGTYNYVPYGGTEQRITRGAYSNVEFARIRRLPFNGGRGISSGSLYVSVDGVQSFANFSGVGVVTPYAYELYDAARVKMTAPGLAHYISFTGSEHIGVPRNSIIRIVSERGRNYFGAAGFTDSYLFDGVNGGWIGVYGISKFCDYQEGKFFSVSSFIQNRLVLGGFLDNAMRLVFSRQGEFLNQEDFMFFQITDALTNPTIDPFDAYLNFRTNDKVLALVTWQDALYAFCRYSTHRVIGAEGQISSITAKPVYLTNQGALNPRAVCTTESTILFLSDTALLDLSPILEGEYRAAERSEKIRPLFSKAGNRVLERSGWVSYDPTNFRIYVGLPGDNESTEADILMVYSTKFDSWTKYDSPQPFKTYVGYSYVDNTLGRLFLVVANTPCLNGLLRFDYPKHADYIVKNTGSATVSPVFRIQETYPDVLEYPTHMVGISARNFQSHRVFYGVALDAMSELDFGVDWTYNNDLTVELAEDPGTGFIAFVPNVPDSWNGFVAWVDNILTSPTFGIINFEDPCTCLTGSYGGTESCTFTVNPDAVVEAGIGYPAEFKSPMITQELLSEFKRVVHLSVMFQNDLSKYSIADINPLTQEASDLVNQFKNPSQVSLGIGYQADLTEEIITDVYNLDYTERPDANHVYKEALSGVGYSYQVHVFSYNPHSWKLNGYQVSGEIKRRFHSSGSRTS